MRVAGPSEVAGKLQRTMQPCSVQCSTASEKPGQYLQQYLSDQEYGVFGGAAEDQNMQQGKYSKYASNSIACKKSLFG